MPTIAGTKGDWDVTVKRGESPEPIRIRYTPHADASGCTDVRLSQTTTRTAFDAAGAPVDIADGSQRAGLLNPLKHRKDDEVPEGDGRTRSIDHRACEGDPYANGDDPEDQSSRGDATKTPPEPTRVNDAPGAAFADVRPDIQKIELEVETCAVCASTGEILGCIRWKSVWDRVPPPRDEQRTGRIEFDPAQAEQPPTDAFRQALWRFLLNHVEGTPDGKVRFTCREPTAGVDPHRGEVPGPVLDRWLGRPAAPQPPVEQPGDEGAPGEGGGGERPGGADHRQGFRLDPDDEDLGTGPRHASLGDAFRAVMEDPATAVVKLSWTGTHAPALPSVVMSGPLGVTPGLVTRFVDAAPAVASDFVWITAAPLPVPRMRALLHAVAPVAERSDTHGRVLLTLISNVYDPLLARGYAVTVDADRLADALGRLCPPDGDPGDERAVYGYVQRNFAFRGLEDEGGKRGTAEPEGCLGALIRLFRNGLIIPVQDQPPGTAAAAALLGPCDAEAPKVGPAVLPARVAVEQLPAGEDLDVPARDAAVDAARAGLRRAKDQVGGDATSSDEALQPLGDQRTKEEKDWRDQRNRAVDEELRRDSQPRPPGDTQYEDIRAAGQTTITHRVCTYWTYHRYRSGNQWVECCVLRFIRVQPRAAIRINPRRRLYILKEGDSQERKNQDAYDALPPAQQARWAAAEPFSVEAHERAHVTDYVALLTDELQSVRLRAFVTTKAEWEANDRRIRAHVEHMCDLVYARYTLLDLQSYPHGRSEKQAVRAQRKALDDGETKAREAFAREDRLAEEAVADAIAAETGHPRRRCIHQPEATPHCLRAD